MFKLSLLGLAAIVLTACGGDPVGRWQLQVRDYINDEHNGDANALRHYAEPIAQREFSIIGGSTGGLGLVAPSRSDTTGVMLGTARAGKHIWHVFLVGVIKYTGSFDWLPLEDPEVQDIRLAAFRLDTNGRFIWRITEPDPEALALYIQPQHQQWGQRYAAYDTVDQHPHTVFPWEGDQFDFEVGTAPQTITAHERTSGATWSLHLVPREDRERLAASE